MEGAESELFHAPASAVFTVSRSESYCSINPGLFLFDRFEQNDGPAVRVVSCWEINRLKLKRGKWQTYFVVNGEERGRDETAS